MIITPDFRAFKAAVTAYADANKELKDFLNGPLRNTEGPEWVSVKQKFENAKQFYQGCSEAFIEAMTMPTGYPAPWYGVKIDKAKYRLVLEDETEDSVYLKIVKIQPGEK